MINRTQFMCPGRGRATVGCAVRRANVWVIRLSQQTQMARDAGRRAEDARRKRARPVVLLGAERRLGVGWALAGLARAHRWGGGRGRKQD